MGLACQRRGNVLVTMHAKVLEQEACACCYSQEDNKSTTLQQAVFASGVLCRNFSLACSW